MTLALIRGAFLNQFEMQSYEPLVGEHKITAFASRHPIHDDFNFPVIKLPSPTDLPNFPYKMPILNRFFGDAHVLFGLENQLVGFDIAHCAETYYYYTKQCLNAKKWGIVKKVVATVWENIPFNNESIPRRKEMKKRAIKEVDHFLAVTNQAKEALIKEGCNPGKITVIPMGVDLERFKPQKINNASLDFSAPNRRFEMTERKQLNILFVGRLEEEKGVLDLISAFISLVGQGIKKNVNLTLVGKGSLEPKIRKMVSESRVGERIKVMTLPHRGIEEAYQASDIFVLPSKPTRNWQEQFGMALVEAMASGLPVISTTSGAIPEVVGDCGVLVKPGNEKQLKEALKNLIDSPAKRADLGKRVRERAEKLFDHKTIAQRISGLYKSLC